MHRGTYLLILPWEVDAIGGVSQVVSELYRQLERSGELEPRVLIPDWSATRQIDEVDGAGRRITRLRLRVPFNNPWPIFELARYVAVFAGEMRRLAVLVRSHDVRVANCHYIGNPSLVWLLAKAVGVFRGKVVLSLHGLDIRTIATVRGIRRAIWRRALESADAIVACSRGLAEETVESLALSGRNVVTIYNGVESQRLVALAEGSSGPNRPRAAHPHLVNLGTFEHKKGHDLLLRAFARLLERFPQAHLTIVGRKGPTFESTRALTKELRLQDRVTISPDASHELALAALRDADVFVLPSRNEAFSVAMLEAGAIGKPVVAANVCGVPELVEDHESGILVPPENVDALLAGIVEVLENPAAAAAYGQALQRRVRETFTAEVTFQRYLALVS